MNCSECDSIEFGKEKVIEKRKVRKIFSNFINASSSSEKKEALEKLALEVGLKIDDYDTLFITTS